MTVKLKLTPSHRRLISWLRRTPVQTFVIWPLAVIAFEIGWRHGAITFVPWGLPLMLWGFLQYKLVGRYRRKLAGGGPGIERLPERIISTGPYRLTRNPMYLGHLIFLTGLAITLWSWFAVVVLIGRAIWFHRRVMGDEVRLRESFGPGYDSYCERVGRWLPGL